MKDAPVSDPLRVEELCDQLRELWGGAILGTGPRPRIEDLLETLPESCRDAATGPMLRTEWEEREYSGDGPVFADYLARFPRHADLIHELAGTKFEPDMVPGYRLICEIGRGGTGVVYLADEFDPNGAVYRQVALQLVRRDCDQSVRTAWMMEHVAVAGRVHHDRLVEVYHVRQVKGRMFFTMRYFPGGSLLDRIRDQNRRPLSPREAVSIAEQIASAIDYLHGHECGPILHLDIKPGNVLLDADGRAFVTDFGLSRLLSAATSVTIHDRMYGTPQYMAPEHLRHTVGPQCDVYSIGATLYEMLTGRAPFQGSTPAETARQVFEEPLQSPRRANPEVDRELERLCLRCLEKNPEHRYRTVAEVLRDLRHYLKTGQGPTPLTFWEWFGRTMEKKVPFEQADVWSRITRFWAGYTFVGHGIMFALLKSDLPGWGYWAWYLAFHLVGWGPLLVKLWLPKRPLDETEWGLILNWLGATIADGLLLALFCPLAGTPPESVAKVYSAWMVMHGLMWIMEARSYWGRFYVLGISFLVAAAAMPFVGRYAPLVFASVNSTALFWLSVALQNRVKAKPVEQVSPQPK